MFIHERCDAYTRDQSSSLLWTMEQESAAADDDDSDSSRREILLILNCVRSAAEEIVDHQREILPLLHARRPLVGDEPGQKKSFQNEFLLFFEIAELCPSVI